MRRLLVYVALSALFYSNARAQNGNNPQEGSAARECAEGYAHCAGIGEPYHMCCPIGSQCISLTGGTTKLCCPPGGQSGCADIAPITCNMTLQNATMFRKSQLSTTLLDAGLELPTCDLYRPTDPSREPEPGCCPFGYLCDPTSKKRCRRQKDQENWRTSGLLELTPKESSALSRQAALKTVTYSGPATPSTTAGLQDPPKGDAANAGKFPLSIFLGGLFGGIALGGTITIVLGCCIGSRVNKRKLRAGGLKEIKGLKIGKPEITDQDSFGRTDYSSQYTPSRNGSPHIYKPENFVKSAGRRVSRSVRARSRAAATGLGISLRDPEAALRMASVPEIPPPPPPKERHYPVAPHPSSPFDPGQSLNPRHSQRSPYSLSPEARSFTPDEESKFEESRSLHTTINRDTYTSVYSTDGGRQTIMGAYHNGVKLSPLSFVDNGRPLTAPTDRSSYIQAAEDLENELQILGIPEQSDQEEVEVQEERPVKEERPNTYFPGPLLPKVYDPNARKLA